MSRRETIQKDRWRVSGIDTNGVEVTGHQYATEKEAFDAFILLDERLERRLQLRMSGHFRFETIMRRAPGQT